MAEFLKVDDYQDFCCNGLQVEGQRDILNIASCVTSSLDAITMAKDNNVDTLLVHHGIFWNQDKSQVTGYKAKRLTELMLNNINLFVYHLPLDGNTQLGNNAMLGSILNCSNVKPASTVRNNLLWSGDLANNMSPIALKELLGSKLSNDILHISSGRDNIRTIAWCTGAGYDFIHEAHALGADAFITGESTERTYHLALELGIDFFACGHHATERYGIIALGEHIAQKYAVKHQYIELANPC